MNGLSKSGIVKLLNTESIICGKFQFLKHHLLLYPFSNRSLVVTLNTKEDIDGCSDNEYNGIKDDDNSGSFITDLVSVLIGYVTGVRAWLIFIADIICLWSSKGQNCQYCQNC